MKRNIILLLIGLFTIITLLFMPRLTEIEIITDTPEVNMTIENEENQMKEFLRQEVEKAGLTNRDYLILVEIIQCESSWNHFYKTGEVKVSAGNIGLAQINRLAHYEEYEKLGLDPYDPLQNMQYAVILYKRNGIKDWEKWSGHCFIPRLEKIGITL